MVSNEGLEKLLVDDSVDQKKRNLFFVEKYPFTY